MLVLYILSAFKESFCKSSWNYRYVRVVVLFFVALQLSWVREHSEGWLIIYPVPPEEWWEGAKDPHPAGDPAQSPLSDGGQQRLCQRPHTARIPHCQGSCDHKDKHRHALYQNERLLLSFPAVGGHKWAGGAPGFCSQRCGPSEASWFLPGLQSDGTQHHCLQGGGHRRHHCYWDPSGTQQWHDSGVRKSIGLMIVGL